MLTAFYERHRQLLPTGILAGFCMYSILTATRGIVILDGTAYNFVLTPAHYGAITAVIVTLFSFFFARKLYKYLFGLTLALSLLDVIHFGPIQFNAGLTFGEWHIGMNLVCLLAGGTAYFLAYRRVNALVLAPFRYDQQKLKEIHCREIQEFKARFVRKSSEDLQQIITDNRLVPAAVTAARQLLQERQTAS